MITVYHGNEAFCSWSVTDAIVGEDSIYQAEYFIGHQPPNYSIPAIRLLVIRFNDDVAIFQADDTRGNDCVYSLNYPLEVY